MKPADLEVLGDLAVALTKANAFAQRITVMSHQQEKDARACLHAVEGAIAIIGRYERNLRDRIALQEAAEKEAESARGWR